MDVASPSTSATAANRTAESSLRAWATVGATYLALSSLTYAFFGIRAFPDQEWLLETQISIIFLLPIVNLIRRVERRDSLVRLIGGMLILHSVWDALHWPGRPVVLTPVSAWLPQFCPFLDLPLGAWLWIAGNSRRNPSA